MSNQPSAQRYLAQEIENASPTRLRLMLIERAVDLAHSLASYPSSAPTDVRMTEQSLLLRDILGELLAGVGKSDLPIAQQVADLYVFLLQHLSVAEETRDPQKWSEIASVLEIEQDTWRSVCARSTIRTPVLAQKLGGATMTAAHVAGSLNFEA